MKKQFLLLFILFILPYSIYGASADFRFKHLTVEGGLSSNTVWALSQDNTGFIWIGTDAGLCRYDGSTLKEYRYKTQGDNYNYITAINQDAEQMWIGTDMGVLIFSFIDETFHPFDIETNRNVSINHSINNITRDKDGNLWFSTYGQGIFKYNPQQNLLEQFEFPANSGLVSHVFVDSENRIWAVTNQGRSHVYRFNRSVNDFEPFNLTYSDNGLNSRSLTIYEDSNHVFWLGTWECGLQRLDPYNGEIVNFLHPSSGGIMHIHAIMEYAPNKLLIGSDDGLSLFDTKTLEHKVFVEDEMDVNSISSRFVYPLLKDKEGGIWLGTYYGGVNYISPTAGQFDCFVASKYKNSVSGNVISAFCEDNQGNIWIASDDGGLNCYDPLKNRFTHFRPDYKNKNSLSYHNIHSLCVDNQDIWIGTYSRGVNKYNIQTGKFSHYIFDENDPNSLDGTSSYAMFKDREDRLWITTINGINLYNKESDDFIRIKDLDALTQCICQDTKGNLWFGTLGKGLFKYEPNSQVWKNYTKSEKTGGLVGNNVNSVLVDSRGQLWIATTDGLCRYNVNSDLFETVLLEIPSNNISCIIEDQHVLWLTTTKGLIRYIPGENVQVFSKSDGLQNDQFLPNSGFKTSTGKIYIGSVKGFNAFYPYDLRINQQIPPVKITGVELFNKELPVGHDLLESSPERTKSLVFSHKENFVSFRFASLSYCTPDKNQFAYKLEGFDKDWIYTGSQNKATYTNLPYGDYTFRVKASNNDGIWNEEGASLLLTIRPPFYKTIGFKILYCLLAILLLSILIYMLLHRSEKKHLAEIERINAEKEREMHDAKISFFTMIAHEIRTPVSLIIGPLEKIIQASAALPIAIKEDLEIINRNSQRLLYLVNQLLDFRKVEQEGLTINCSMQNIYQLMQSVCERFEPTISQRGAQLKVIYPDPEFKASIDREAITKMISNLLTNANKYTSNEVILSCQVKHQQQTFEIRVTDNGTGIKESDQKQIFKPFYQAADNKPGTGIGLSIVKSVVEAHNGCIEIESEPGKGSSFIVTLPIEQPEFMMQPATDDRDSMNVPEDILSEASSASCPKNKPTMLIVDDNPEMLNFLSGSFSDTYQILTAEDGMDALAILKNHDVTLIVSDWMMPKINGVELCKAVRNNQVTSHLPFILLTAKTDIHSKVEGLDCGADAYVEKPFSVQYLHSCIKNLIDLRSLLRQKFSKMPLVPLNSIAGNSADEQLLTRLNAVIEQNFSNPELSIDFLAEQLCISRSGLFAKIKTLANVTPNELIQVVRLKKAAALLQENRYRISEISYMVGFNNPSYFTKCFYKQFGIKPGEFVATKGKKKQEDEA